MWMSMPQMAVFFTLMSRSLCPIFGLGISCNQMPSWVFALTKAFIVSLELFDDAEFAADFAEGGYGLINMFWFMGRRHLGTDARLVLGHHREGEADHIDTLAEQFVCHGFGE